ncbi:MAG: sulfotransferase [Spiribacter salinus]|uniref:Sulfotransferase n=1 Tax=Spiribacter salinus TaxID=1335746 RepID=A0A540VRY1_9GAMM|nr:MAG: sulfotransferase [Spiribacter salinus]
MASADNSALVLHLGLPKTSSTWLQKSVFPGLANVIYAGHMSWRRYGTGRDAMRLDKLFRQEPGIWQADGSGILDAMTRETASQPGTTLLLSEEKIVLPRFFGEAVSAGEDQTIRLGRHLEGLRAAALARGFDRVAVLIVFRRQDHWLASRYAQSSSTITGACQSHFEAETRRIIHDAYSSLGMQLNYARLRQVLRDAVGVENVHMIPYEKLVAAPQAFMQDVYRALGASTQAEQLAVNHDAQNNVRRAAPGTWSLRPNRASIKVPSWARRLAGGRRHLALSGNRNAGTIELPARLGEEILGVYESANRQLAANVGENLRSYGYFSGGPD